jgi:hypothetical protein
MKANNNLCINNIHTLGRSEPLLPCLAPKTGQAVPVICIHNIQKFHWSRKNHSPRPLTTHSPIGARQTIMRAHRLNLATVPCQVLRLQVSSSEDHASYGQA